MSAVDRSRLTAAKRVVVKVGSSSISGDASWRIPLIVSALAAAHQKGVEVVLVSSGAIATGFPYLTMDHQPHDLATQQAAAAVGQSILMYQYQQALRPFNIVAGQVLLTTNDLRDVTSRSNAQRAMERLLNLRIVPIVNENDTVATQEIRFGDNDRLAALVAQLIDADALLLLSDVDALYTRAPEDPEAVAIDVIYPDSDLRGYSFGSVVVNSVGTGGAATKVSAARLAAASGVAVLVTSADHVSDALLGMDVGTWFVPTASL